MYTCAKLVLQPQSYSSKLRNKNVDSIDDLNISTTDLISSNITSKSIYVPVRNNTDDEVMLKRGQYLGHTTDIEIDNAMDSNIASINVITSEVMTNVASLDKHTVITNEEGREKLNTLLAD